VTRTNDATLYRADSRAPSEIIQDGGFQPKDINGNYDIQAHVEKAPPGAFVSTTYDASFTPQRSGDWFYEIQAPGGIDLEATANTFHNITPNAGEAEVLFPGGIDVSYIKSAKQYVSPGLNMDPAPVDSTEYQF
jgi:hypothetical protein